MAIRIELDGTWAFRYSSTPPRDAAGIPIPPAEEMFCSDMPVPGIWDDHEDLVSAGAAAGEILRNPLHIPTGFKYAVFRGAIPSGGRLDAPVHEGREVQKQWQRSLLTDGTLPNIVGMGWYRKGFRIPAGLSPCVATLEVGGVFLEAWVFLNGSFLSHHFGHSTPFNVPLDEAMSPEGENRLCIGVSNMRFDRIGTSIRGFAGQSGGIYRSVSLSVRRGTGIEDLYVRTDQAMEKLHFTARLRGETDGCLLEWKVLDPARREVAGAGFLQVHSCSVDWDAPSLGMRPWSEYDPALYEVRLRLLRDGTLLDERRQGYGLRWIGTMGRHIILNGSPVFLRGATDHCYWPLTTTVPTDRDFCRKVLARLKELGFNWIRCHTWVPAPEYLDAADELGLMIQVEAPAGFGEQEWRDICLSCRTHPSVVLYCGGNEEVLDEPMIDHLERMAAILRELVPDALFNPHEALRGVEYRRSADPGGGLGEPVEPEPFPHNPVRLRRLESFSDVLGAYAHGRLSYNGISGRVEDIDRELALYKLPCLSHEIGIQGTYFDVSLEYRYRHLRIGPDMHSILRKALEDKGLIHKAAEYYAQSCRFHRLARKHVVETARRSTLLAGYDYLGPGDSHWARTGYPCGMLNEFFEYKPGESAEVTRRYNDDCVLLLDVGNDRNYRVRSPFVADLFVSNYWHSPLSVSSLEWLLLGADGTIHESGSVPCPTVANGGVHTVGQIRFAFPDLPTAEHLILRTTLRGSRLLENEWDLYCYPSRQPRAVVENGGGDTEAPFPGPLVVRTLTEEAVQRADRGDTVVLLGHEGLPSERTEFKVCLAGRESGIQATIVNPHPAVDGFPSQGFCDLSFRPMLEGGHVYDFERMEGVPFDPIIEVVSSFKNVKRLAALFELRVGRGKLLCCSLNLASEDPGCRHFREGLLAYAAGGRFRPVRPVPAARLCDILRRPTDERGVQETDMALDPNTEELKEHARRIGQVLSGGT